MPQDRPNILIFMTDQQRGDTALPTHPAITPNVDALARRGVQFTEASCPSPHCCPSRATFMTGLYPSRHGVWNNVSNTQALSTGFAPGVRCWSEDLAAAGYDLHYWGKWHATGEENPRDRGWQEHIITASTEAYMGPKWEWYQENHDSERERGYGELRHPGYAHTTFFGTTDQPDNDEAMAAEVTDFLRDPQRKEGPWCTYLGTFGPHDPFVVPQRYLDLYPELPPLPPTWSDTLEDKPRIYQRMARMFAQFGEEEARDAIRHYWAYCSWMDDLFGQIMVALEESGQLDNTVVMYVSDHGEYAGDHRLWCKGIPAFRQAYNVPLVMAGPGISGGGRQENAFVSLADIGPTLLETAGLDAPDNLSGKSLRPFLEGREPDCWRTESFHMCNGVEVYFTQRILVSPEFKYVYNAFDFDELYDLQADPHEMTNLAEDPACADTIQQMCSRLWQIAHAEGDQAMHNYYTVRLAPVGPGSAFSEG